MLKGASTPFPMYPGLKRTELSKSSTITKFRSNPEREMYDFWSRIRGLEVTSYGPAQDANLAFSGSNQAREGRLVDALAVRGDEGRDTLR